MRGSPPGARDCRPQLPWRLIDSVLKSSQELETVSWHSSRCRFDYDFSRTFDDALWQPRNSEAADWDTSSSYNRSIEQAGEPERS